MKCEQSSFHDKGRFAKKELRLSTSSKRQLQPIFRKTRNSSRLGKSPPNTEELTPGDDHLQRTQYVPRSLWDAEDSSDDNSFGRHRRGKKPKRNHGHNEYVGWLDVSTLQRVALRHRGTACQYYVVNSTNQAQEFLNISIAPSTSIILISETADEMGNVNHNFQKFISWKLPGYRETNSIYNNPKPGFHDASTALNAYPSISLHSSLKSSTKELISIFLETANPGTRPIDFFDQNDLLLLDKELTKDSPSAHNMYTFSSTDHSDELSKCLAGKVNHDMKDSRSHVGNEFSQSTDPKFHVSQGICESDYCSSMSRSKTAVAKAEVEEQVSKSSFIVLSTSELLTQDSVPLNLNSPGRDVFLSHRDNMATRLSNNFYEINFDVSSKKEDYDCTFEDIPALNERSSSMIEDPSYHLYVHGSSCSPKKCSPRCLTSYDCGYVFHEEKTPEIRKIWYIDIGVSILRCFMYPRSKHSENRTSKSKSFRFLSASNSWKTLALFFVLMVAVVQTPSQSAYPARMRDLTAIQNRSLVNELRTKDFPPSRMAYTIVGCEWVSVTSALIIGILFTSF